MLKITERLMTTTDCGKMARVDQWRYTCECCNQQVTQENTSGRMWHWFTCKLIQDLSGFKSAVVGLTQKKEGARR